MEIRFSDTKEQPQFYLSRLTLVNFKSFRKVDVDLNNLNILIGKNASGKSNFTQVFKFLNDIIEHDLETAISLQGGIKYFKNIKSKDNEPLSIKLVFLPKTTDKKSMGPILKISSKERLNVLEVNYEFSLNCNSKTGESKISKDELTLKIVSQSPNRSIKNGFIKIKRLAEGIKIDISPDSVKKIILVGSSRKQISKLSKRFAKNRLLIEGPLFLIALKLNFESLEFLNLFENIGGFFNRMIVYDFDPKISKIATQVAGKRELAPNGENLALVLKRILNNNKQKKKFFDLLESVLPFVKELKVESILGKSIFFDLTEIYSHNKSLPSFLLSDGTVNMTALICALFFENSSLVVIEEPERDIHPGLFYKVIELLKKASEDKQIIITTHSPDLLDLIEVEKLLFIFRDKKGTSKISKPKDNLEVKRFIESNIKLGGLFIQGLLK